MTFDIQHFLSLFFHENKSAYIYLYSLSDGNPKEPSLFLENKIK